MLRNRLTDKLFLSRAIVIIIMILPAKKTYGQNCQVDFPGTSSLNFSETCGGTIDDLELGKNVCLGDNDIFIFDSPSIITINGDLVIKTEGSGLIIIPEGVTVNVSGDFILDPVNGGCEPGSSCGFEIKVFGTLNLDKELTNTIATLVWPGTGTVSVIKDFGNSSNACMEQGVNFK